MFEFQTLWSQIGLEGQYFEISATQIKLGKEYAPFNITTYNNLVLVYFQICLE